MGLLRSVVKKIALVAAVAVGKRIAGKVAEKASARLHKTEAGAKKPV